MLTHVRCVVKKSYPKHRIMKLLFFLNMAIARAMSFSEFCSDSNICIYNMVNFYFIN